MSPEARSPQQGVDTQTALWQGFGAQDSGAGEGPGPANTALSRHGAPPVPCLGTDHTCASHPTSQGLEMSSWPRDVRWIYQVNSLLCSPHGRNSRLISGEEGRERTATVEKVVLYTILLPH